MSAAIEVAQGIIEEAVGRALNVSEKGAIATKWFMVVEFMGESGQKFLFRLGDDESYPWEHEGMLQYAADHMEDDDG